MSLPRVTLHPLALLLAAGLLAPAAAAAPPSGGEGRAAGPGLQSIRWDRDQARRSLRYWSSSRTRSAATRRPPRSPLRALHLPPFGANRVAPGRPTVMPARGPRGPKRALLSHAPVSDPGPYQAHGRLFFRFGPAKASCTATAINTPRMNLALTAGHCLRDPFSGVWSRFVVFAPGYENGRRPHGSFAAKAGWVLRDWGSFGNPNFDVGVVVLRPSDRGRVGDVVGGSGWATGLSRWRDFDIFGYPVGGNRGRSLRHCMSRSYRADRFSYRIPGPPNLRAFCSMARGSSGGAWLTEHAGEQVVNGVISYARPKRFDVMFSPYFGAAVKRLIARAR